MFELIAFIVLCLSILAIAVILYRKAPVLATLPKNGTTGIKKHQIISDIENRIKKILIALEKQVFLHKFLSWLKCQILKAEVKVDHLLHGIRKKAQEIDKQASKNLPK